MKKEHAFLIVLFAAFAVAVSVIGLSVLRASVGGDAATDSVSTEPHTESTQSVTEPPETEPPATESETVTETVPPETEPPIKEFTSGQLHVSGDYTPSDDAVSALNDAIDKFDRPTGIYAYDLTTGMTITYNADTKFAPASIVKVVYALYCCRQIDAGEASLDEMLTFKAEDYIHGNGSIAKMGVGAQVSIRDVLRYVIRTSDNEGYYMLLRRFGRRGCDEMLASLGVTSCRVTSSRWPDITPRDYGLVWQEIFRYKDESDTGMMLYELLISVDYMHFFRDALGVTVANKSGWNEESYNEGGIVYGDRIYVLVVLTSGSYYTADKDEFADIVRAADAMIKEYNASLTSPTETEA